jgi:hypothetical protein
VLYSKKISSLYRSRIMGSIRFFSIISVMLLAGCSPLSSFLLPTSTIEEKPRSTPVISITPSVTEPTPTIGPTADPRSKYEGECAFCFIGDSNPREPVWDLEARGFTYHPDDPREILRIDETYYVPAGETVEIINKIVLVQPTQRKNILVDGTLIIRDSLMIWLQTEYQQTRLIVRDGGELYIKDSYSFWGNQYWVNWEFEDGSKIRFDHFIGDPWTSLDNSVDYQAINFSTTKLTIGNHTQDSSIIVRDAHHLYLELFPPPGTHTLTLPEKHTWDDWLIEDLWPNTIIDARESYIFERDVSLSNGTHITIEDTPSGFSIGWAIHKNEPGFVDCELRGLGEPGDESGVFYELEIWELPCNNSSLTVKNSLLQRSWPVTWGWIHLKIFDSFLVDVRNYGEPATIEIYDSSLDIIAAYRGGRVYVENTPLREAVEVKDPDSEIYFYQVPGNYKVLESDGGKWIMMDQAGPPW